MLWTVVPFLLRNFGCSAQGAQPDVKTEAVKKIIEKKSIFLYTEIPCEEENETRIR